MFTLVLYWVLKTLKPSNISWPFTRSVKGRLRTRRASTRYTRSMSRLLTGKKGTRPQPPEPFSVLP